MKILFLSKLNGDSFAGPSYSVPNQIEVQSKIDEVLWINLVDNGSSELIKKWRELPYYRDLSTIPSLSYKYIKSHLMTPDLIVVECFYDYPFSKLILDIIKAKEPYIIIPRGELTLTAQKRKKYKKIIANVLFFYKFLGKARAVQFLTNGEMVESKKMYNGKSAVIPNGIYLPSIVAQENKRTSTKTFSIISRLEPYAKGLDILIDAVSQKKELLKKEGCLFRIFGPDVDNKSFLLKEMIFKNGLSDIVFVNDAVYGKDKVDVLLSTDVFVMTSRLEGLPMALLESLSYGIPCLVTSGTNMNDKIDEYHAGWTAENNPISVAEALEKCIKEFDSLDIFKKNARALSREYSWESIATTSHCFYEDVVLAYKSKK